MARPQADLRQHPQAADLFGAALGRCENGIMVLDRQARIVFWNNWIAAASGVPVQAAQGRTLAEVFPESNLEQLERAVGLALGSRQSSVLSRALNPRLLPLRQAGDDGEPIEHQAIVKSLDAREGRFCLIQVYDVTDAAHREVFLKKQAADLTRLAAHLSASERTLRSMLEASPIGVAILDAGGRIRFANARLATLFLATPALLAGASAADFFTHPRNLLARLDRAIERLEVQFRRRDGSLMWAQVSAGPIEFEQSAAILCWVYDISEQKQTELALVGERDRATELMRARTDFLAMVSHEIRTPLNGIMGTVRMLGDTPLAENQREYVDMIRYSGDSLLTILNDVLDLSKFESGHISLELQQFDVVRLVDSLAHLMSGRAQEKGLSLSVEVGPAVGRAVVADAGRLRQVLLNLIGNAIKFTEVGGIVVRVEQLDDSGQKVRMRFSVIDTGIGIPAEARPELFTEFYQVDPTAARRLGGTGLGLAICKRIVEAMGGSIGVESMPTAGSTFWFTLPLERGDDGAVAGPLRRDPEHRPAAARRLLLVEDNEINQKVALNLLSRDGHEVVVAETGTEALRRIAAMPFDAILMDIQLPEMDGVEATRRIRDMADRTIAATPIIALTANAMPGDAQRYLDAGMNEVLTKPIDPERLSRAIERLTGSQEATPAGAVRIDGSMLDGLRAAIGDAKVEELVDLFATSGRATIDEIVAAAARDRRDTCAALAHRLKGGALNLGFTSVSDAAVAIELAVQNDRDTAALEGLINALADAHAATLAALRSGAS